MFGHKEKLQDEIIKLKSSIKTLSNIVSLAQFRELATYITNVDKILGLEGTEVQDDLIKFADALEELEANK